MQSKSKSKLMQNSSITTLHKYFLVINKKCFLTLKRFFARYVIPYIRGHKCMVCFETNRAVYKYCTCTFIMCSVCFDKIIFECPQCRNDLECVNNTKHSLLLIQRNYLNRALYRSWDKLNISKILNNIRIMIEQNDKQCTRCMDIVEIVSKMKKQRVLQLEQTQAEQFVDLLNAAFQSNNNNEERSYNGDDIFNMFFGRRRGVV